MQSGRAVIRPLKSQSNSAIVESLQASSLTRLDHLRTSIRVSEHTRDFRPDPGELRILLTPDVTPISEYIARLPGPVDVSAHIFDADGDVLSDLRDLRRRGKISNLAYRVDQEACERMDKDTYEWWASTPDRVERCATHAKQWVIRGADYAHTLISSSNDGALKGRLEWWATTADPALAAELSIDGPAREPVPVTHRGKEPVKGFNRALDLMGGTIPANALLRTTPEIPSGGLLFALIHLMGGGCHLGMMSMSTSMRFLQALGRARQTDQISSLAWSIDHSILQRLGGQHGHTDIRPHLEAHVKGCYILPRERIHAKWATIRNASGCVSVLTSANWQSTNPREEQYLITTDPAVCAKLEAVQAAINVGRVIR